MKHFVGLLLAFVVVTACHRPTTETYLSTTAPKTALSTIDSLMWEQPDSAFAVLMDFAASPEADSLDVFNGCYCQLLISELLYKNDYKQTNRPELLKSLAFFDSIGDTFLSARCHYMNGVGYYEMDSVVLACREYLKASEIMETRFEEKAFVEHKARFMALTNTRLCVLFSRQYLHEQAVHFGLLALSCYKLYDASPAHVGWMLNNVGSHYEILGAVDSALYCYKQALKILPDTNALIGRDVRSHLAFLLHEKTGERRVPLKHLFCLAESSTNEEERAIRYATIGAVYYFDSIYDSAWIYLDTAFRNTTNITIKKLSAEWLIEIAKLRDQNDDILSYAKFVSQFAIQNETQGIIKSQLSDLLLQYEKAKQERLHKKNLLLWLNLFGLAGICFMFVVGLAFIVFWKKNKRKHRAQAKKIEDLKEFIKTDSFEEEPICQYILSVASEQHFKANIDYNNYKSFALNKNQLIDLRNAANLHYSHLFKSLMEKYNKLTEDDLNYCCLYLLGLKDADVAAFMQKTFSAVCHRKRKLKQLLGSEQSLCISLRQMNNKDLIN